MTIAIVMLLGALLAFGLGWLSGPKYSPTMSKAKQIGIVALVSAVAALVVGYLLGNRGLELVLITVLSPLVFVAPYAGGMLKERQQTKVNH